MGTALAIGTLACSAGPPQGFAEKCANGGDDDGNGLADCDDPACAVECGRGDGGFFGICARCGQGCALQTECFSNGYADEPLPQCLSGVCRAHLEGIRIRFEVDVSNWSGLSVPVRSMNTRFVLKTALDGSAVSCATVQGIASSNQAADANQIERTGRFNLLAYDVSPVSEPLPKVIIQPFLPVGTGKDFLIWTELWSGTRDSGTKLPTGMRLGWGCFETGAAVDEIKTEHHWPGSTPTDTSRTIKIKLPAPQG